VKQVYVVPEPKRLEFTGRLFKFDGFKNFPKFIAEEFKVPVGGWSIVKVDRNGTGVKIGEGIVEIWGDERVCYATLIQLVTQSDGQIPEATIEEEFSFKFRGFHLDIARGGAPKVETFKSIIRWLYLLKYNYFAVYVEDLFPWKSYPQIGVSRGRLTEEEWNTIVDYGEKLGVEVFPSLELCGHMEHILSIPEFRRFSEWHRPMEGCLDVSSEEAREFAYRLLSDALELTRSNYVHIGGDETWALGRGTSLNKTWRFEGPSLYERHHRRLVEIVRGRGKTPILWGDMISGMYLVGDRERWAEALQSDIWRESMIANWDYSPESIDHFRRKIDIFKNRGLEQIACPGLSNWDRFYPNFEVAIANLRNFLTAAKEKNVLGFMVTAWGDDGEECLFSLLTPLILASMEIAEGSGEWEKKWIALSGESEAVLKARLIFGRGEVSDIFKHVLYATPILKRMRSERLEKIAENWKTALETLRDTVLPKDLEFIRKCLEVCLNRLKGSVKVSDYITLARLYSELWLSERKPEGLELIVTRFWGAAGRADLNLQ
jgi:hexosaminidase